MAISTGFFVLPAFAGVCAWSACHPSAQMFGRTQRKTRSDAVALTFDDGPNPTVTPQLLDLLERYGARATFFLIGRHVRACPGLAREIVRRGHAVGNHTETHPNLLWLSRAQVAEELIQCSDAIANATALMPTLMRPPYGYRGPHVHRAARQLDLGRPVMWSKGARDWTNQPLTRLIDRLGAVRGGDIVLLHDGSHTALGGDRQRTVAALEHWLPRWKARGLDLVALGPSGGAGAGSHTVYPDSPVSTRNRQVTGP